MNKIVFFNIPAWGHTNPTIEVVHELVNRGNIVYYYSFNIFKEKIENTGAKFISCDDFLPPLPDDFDKKSRYDFSSLIGMVTDVTISMEDKVYNELLEIDPDCIVTDSMCAWGKLYAKKFKIPMICSTSSFAFNEKTAKMMKPSIMEMLYSIGGIFKMNNYIRKLRDREFNINNVVELIQNDNNTETIVYTSRLFQPENESFGDRYSFVGPSIIDSNLDKKIRDRPIIYISMGTVLKDINFYNDCIEALKNSEYDVIISVGKDNKKYLNDVPNNITIEESVDQIEVLQKTDLFITHCGMNSVSESIYYKVPMILIPQTSEQGLVAYRTNELGGGLLLKKHNVDNIKESITKIFSNREYYINNLKIISNSFKEAGGAKKAADKIEDFIKKL